MRPLRPPRSLRPFSGNEQRGRLGQCAVLAHQFPLQILDPFLLVLRRLTKACGAGAIPIVCLFTRGPPCRDLRWIKLTGIVKLLPNAEKLAVYVSSCGEFTRVFVPLTKCVSSVLTEGCCVHLMAAWAEQVRGFLMDS